MAFLLEFLFFPTSGYRWNKPPTGGVELDAEY
jgi:hypothetical protein